MTDQHRATPEQWKTVEIYAEDGSDEDNVTDSCLLELRSRIEALEARCATLAQTERRVTDEQWDAIKDRLWSRYETVGYQGERFIYQGDFDDALDAARQELTRYALPLPNSH
jgi:hypothetical protein